MSSSRGGHWVIAEEVSLTHVSRMSERRDTEQTGDEVDQNRPLPPSPAPKEFGGPKGPEPTRYGDWEVNGRCSDF